MEREFNITIEKGEDGFLISEVIELPGGHTQAKSFDEFIERTKEAIKLYLDCNKTFKFSDKLVGVQKIIVEENS